MALQDVELPVRSRVYQRDANNVASIPLHIHPGARARVLHNTETIIPWHEPKGAIRSVPVGGPYTIEIETGTHKVIRIHGILVGDLWILAGQSNMDGCGKLIDLESPSRMVHAYYYSETWDIAEDPLCVLVDSIDPVHWPCDEKDLGRARDDDHQFREHGAGLGIRFGKELYKALQVPIGLIVCSHGGTSIEQWDPSLKNKGGDSMYGSMYRRVQVCGGNVKGMLWYQGESNANPETCDAYKQRMKNLIKAVRRDLKTPDLPFLMAQIGRFFIDETQFPSAPWNKIQQVQLELENELDQVATVATIDGTLSDAIHFNARSMRLTGARLAELALVIAYGRTGTKGLSPENIRCTDMHRTEVRIRYRNVRGQLQPGRKIWGFFVETPEGVRIPIVDSKTSGNTVILTLGCSAPAKSRLWYGRGTNPTTNLHDMMFAAPVFGPVVI